METAHDGTINHTVSLKVRWNRKVCQDFRPDSARSQAKGHEMNYLSQILKFRDVLAVCMCYVCACSCVCVIYIYAGTDACVQRPEVPVRGLPQPLSTLFLRWDLSQKLELTESGRLAVQ